MGIKGLYKFIQKYAPSAIKELKVDDLKNKTIAFDTSILIYQFVIAIRNSGVDLTNNDGKITSHIHAIIVKTMSFLKKKINPIYVFDGKPPNIKMDTLKERVKNRQNAMQTLQTDENLDDDKKIRLLKQCVVVSSKQMEECKEVLNLIGIPVINSSQEADSQCAYLSKKGLVDAIASEDMDLLTFGTEVLLRNINGTKIIEITLDKILKEAELTMDQFIDLCIMLGCDYCPTIEGIGMCKSYILIKRYGSLNKIVELGQYNIGKRIIKINISNEFKDRYKIAQEYFKNPPINEDINDIQWDKPNFNALTHLLTTKYSYSNYTIDKLINKPLSAGYYKQIAGKNNQELSIDHEILTYVKNMKLEDTFSCFNNNDNDDDQFIDSDDQDNLDVQEILQLTTQNNIKNLISSYNIKTI